VVGFLERLITMSGFGDHLPGLCDHVDRNAQYSLMRTCAQYGVPPLPYFTDILTKLAAGWSMSRLDDRLPHRWRLPVSVTTHAESTNDRHDTPQ
jgi:hypothetical protein